MYTLIITIYTLVCVCVCVCVRVRVRVRAIFAVDTLAESRVYCTCVLCHPYIVQTIADPITSSFQREDYSALFGQVWSRETVQF